MASISTPTLVPVGNVDKMGDGIRMAFEVGAAEEDLGVVEINAAENVLTYLAEQ